MTKYPFHSGAFAVARTLKKTLIKMFNKKCCSSLRLFPMNRPVSRGELLSGLPELFIVIIKHESSSNIPRYCTGYFYNRSFCTVRRQFDMQALRSTCLKLLLDLLFFPCIIMYLK